MAPVRMVRIVARLCKVSGTISWVPHATKKKMQVPQKGTEKRHLNLQDWCLTHDLDREKGNVSYMFLLSHKLFLPP